MKIYEFMSQYCQDIVDSVKASKDILDLSEFPYDAIIKDADDHDVCVIFIDNTPVPIMDVISMNKEDFIAAYNLPHASECFDNYIANLEILEGMDAINRVRNEIVSYKENLNKEIKILEL